ncbi:endonuclease domain-containing protein [Halobacillus kuroshimensis]|uniref:endonuclease domain-containing protein n=1 Tax=Halobacillus kuroshimensis TaxID=302481 RepID=UPI000402D3C6|nr:DUF559 domain-containing protein [Halobacillus kuroshimensis]
MTNSTLFPTLLFFLFLLFSFGLIFLGRRQAEENQLVEKEVSKKALAEKLHSELSKYGLHPQQYYQEGEFIIDMAFPELKIAIEAVEHEYLVSPDEWEMEWERDAFLKNHGWTVLRFSAARIEEDISRIAEKISRELAGRHHAGF